MNAQLNILVAEDDPNDTLLLKRAFYKAGVDTPIHFVTDGLEVIDYLQGKAPYDDPMRHPLPALLLLDLKMPRMNGFEVLEWLREHPDMRGLLVTVFSSSDQPEDMHRAYALGADCFMVKPVNTAEYVGIVKEIENQLSRVVPFAVPAPFMAYGALNSPPPP